MTPDPQPDARRPVQGGGTARRRLRRGLLAAIGLLYVLSIPWYRAPGEAPAVVLGLPGWVAVALGCYVLAAVLNSVAWLLTDVPEREVRPGGEDAG